MTVKSVAIMLIYFVMTSVSADSVAKPLAPAALLQTILDHKSLSPYWHAGQKGRIPLKILTHNQIATDGVTKFQREVQVINAPVQGPYLEITLVRMTKLKAVVQLRYPVEGVVGYFAARKRADNRWVIDKAKVNEK